MVVAIGCLDYLFGTVNSNYVFRSQPEYGVPGINRTVPIYFCISGEIYKSLKCNKKKSESGLFRFNMNILPYYRN